MKLFLQILGFIIMLPFILIGFMIGLAVLSFMFHILASLGAFAIGVLLLWVLFEALLDDDQTREIG